MRSCTREREPLVDCPHSRRIQERPLRAREKRTAERGRRRRLRGRPHETKSLLEHLIKSIRRAERFANGGQTAEDKEHGRQFDSVSNRWKFSGRGFASQQLAA